MKLKFQLLSIHVCLIYATAFSQPFARQIESIPVTVGGQPLQLPWAGGINSPHFQFIDIDGDGDKDVFVVDQDNNGAAQVDFYRNEGTATNPDFHLRPDISFLPSFTFWFVFVDITADGLPDLFTDDGGTGMNYYVNQGPSQNPQFVLVEASLRDSTGAIINAGSYSIPGFADIDADGRVDFFSGNIIGSINFYRNVGTPTNPLFRFITESWQSILFISGGSCCPSLSLQHRSVGVHGASAYSFADIDGDSDYDLFLGDLFHTGIAFFRNQGTPQNPAMVLQDTCFPASNPVCTQGGNQPVFVDINADGDLDFFVGSGVVSGAIVQRHSFHFYENTGTPSLPSFLKRTEDYLSMLDVGKSAVPAIVDINGDGKRDLFVGTTNGELWYFRNSGTSQSPSYQLVDSAFITSANTYSYAPAFVDIDADGDDDLFIGMFDGAMRFYRNNGTATAPQFNLTPSPVDTIRVTYNNAPAFVDIDADGDADLFVGGYNGRIKYYRNAGDSVNFIPLLENTSYQNILTGQNAKPCFADIDGDGDFDLFVGTSEGRIEFFENIGTSSNALFTRRTNHYASTDPMQEAAPAFVDIDGDGDLDLFVGVLTGGIHFYRNNAVTSVVDEPFQPNVFHLYQNYPNPFNPTTVIRYAITEKGVVSLKVYDILGKEIATVVNGTASGGTYEAHFIAPPNLASGVYVYRLRFVPDGLAGRPYQESKKLLLVR